MNDLEKLVKKWHDVRIELFKTISEGKSNGDTWTPLGNAEHTLMDYARKNLKDKN